MNKISFESRYKFIVSLGIILLISPFVTIYTLSEMSKDMLITNNLLNELNETSIKILEKKQEIYIKLLSSYSLYIFLFIIFIIGGILLVAGLYEWGKFQKQEYHKLDLENKHSELENEHSELENKKLKKDFGLSFEEQKAKIEREIAEEKEIFGKENNSVTSSKYFKIEQLVADKIVEKFSITHYIVKGFKLGNVEYDVVARGKEFLVKDYIFEIKYLKSYVTKNWYNRMIDQVRKQSNNYSDVTNRLPYKQVIIVTENENYNQVKDFISTQDKIDNLSIIVIEKDEIKDYKFEL